MECCCWGAQGLLGSLGCSAAQLCGEGLASVTVGSVLSATVCTWGGCFPAWNPHLPLPGPPGDIILGDPRWSFSICSPLASLGHSRVTGCCVSKGVGHQARPLGEGCSRHTCALSVHQPFLVAWVCRSRCSAAGGPLCSQDSFGSPALLPVHLRSYVTPPEGLPGVERGAGLWA